MRPFTPDFKSRFRILKGGKVSHVVGAFLSSSLIAYAAPSGGVVTSGSATISSTGSVTTINQSTQKSSINWQNFSIGANETVNFKQPNASAITLNRVVGNERSIIDGALNANGQVWLLNANGVLFGKNAAINTAGLLATTKNISDEAFQAGNYTFGGNSSQGIINLGALHVNDGAYVALFGKEVINKGIIRATLGDVHVKGGEAFALNLNGNSLVNLTVTKGTLNALVENKGAIIADGGEVYLTTNSVDELLKGVVNNSGVVQANTMQEMGGKIVLFAHGGATSVSGSLEAQFVETSGKTLAITSASSIKAAHWLIDPENIVVESAGGADVAGSSIAASAIQNYLNGTGGLTLLADNNIYINQALAWNANQLTLSAGNDIAINAHMHATGSGALALYYGQATSSGGSSRYTVTEGVDVTIPTATAFTWKKGSDGTLTNLVLDNGNLRFGTGTQASIDSMGALLQPFYYDNVTAGRDGWFKLTYSSYPLDYAIGVGGDGANAYNINGDILSTHGYTPLSSVVSNLSINIAKYFEKTGTVSVTMDVATPNYGTIQTTNTYTLNPNTYFMKADTSVVNTTEADLSNMRLWIGTRDDYVGPRDSNYKIKGNIGAEGFEAITEQTQEAKAIIVSEDTFESGNGAAVLFYSTTLGTNTVIQSCCSFTNVINQNPLTSRISTPTQEDGSYGIFLSLGNLPSGQGGMVTWYYAAAPVSFLNETVTQVGESSGSIPTAPPVAPTPTPTPSNPTQAIVTAIINTAATTPPTLPRLQPTPEHPNQAPESTGFSNFSPNTPIQTPLQRGEIIVTNAMTPLSSMGFSEGTRVTLVSKPDEAKPVARVTQAQLQAMQQPAQPTNETDTQDGTGATPAMETRVLVAQDSLIELVNGGILLPEGIDQEFYIEERL
ncbi:filamentous hemagglutinin N-terminal domain-containing protein [Sulfurospirillum sp. T05]|uniref:Filamentous hemagglutinin N-terminal domain-containing protein n=1 Tax=Sulfurospirillum tamanense TaxID=2813362 RepID=A0ABS2WPB2_9BACT|nr:filamentous hemagglutinin N-terminal domain-containing protein [Sulfurospirillum tamanensis]MBN2963536.1 filamentous hemagglutinin N-terminal domain-containing protein [Sulfurospirillum tamanensis]